MKRTLATALAPAALSLALTSAVWAQTTLVPRYQEGTHRLESTENVRQTLTIAGMPIETKITAATQETVIVGKRAEDGTIRVNRRTDGIQARLDLPGGMVVEYDSEKKVETAENPDLKGLIDLWKATVGTSFTVVMDKDDKVTGVEGTEKLIEKLPAGPFTDGFKSSYSPERLKEASLQSRGALPDGPVEKGARWKRTERKSLGGGQSLIFQTNYEYQGTVEKNGRTLDRITLFIESVKYEVEPNGALPVTVKSSELEVKSSSGSVLFDREHGQIIERNITTQVAGKLTLEIMGMELPGALDLTLSDLALVKR